MVIRTIDYTESRGFKVSLDLYRKEIEKFNFFLFLDEDRERNEIKYFSLSSCCYFVRLIDIKSRTNSVNLDEVTRVLTFLLLVLF